MLVAAWCIIEFSLPTAGQGLWAFVSAGACQGTASGGIVLTSTIDHGLGGGAVLSSARAQGTLATGWLMPHVTSSCGGLRRLFSFYY